MSACFFLLGLGGCGSFNPAFVNLLDPTGTGRFSTLDNAPGHIVITVVNNAVVDEQLLSFLESPAGGGLNLTDVEKQALHPRFRARVRATFADGTRQTIEFITGSSNLVDGSVDAQNFPDLVQNDLSTVSVLCDVAAVTLEPGSAIEAFIPTTLVGFERTQTTDAAGNVTGTVFSPTTTFLPQFRPLQVDQIDADGNITLLNNIGTRDVPSPVTNPVCGSVVAIVIDGTLSVPFLPGAGTAAPSFDIGDPNDVGSIGGRFRFLVSVK